MPRTKPTPRRRVRIPAKLRRTTRRPFMPTHWEQFLFQLRKDIFDCAFDPDICGFQTVEDLATAARLCYGTVANLYHGDTNK